MDDDEPVEDRIEAIERAVTDGDYDLAALADAGELAARLERLADRLDRIDERVTTLEAGTQAVRGYVGAVRAVNRDVERRADAALAKAQALEGQRDDQHTDSGPRHRETTHPGRGSDEPSSGRRGGENRPSDEYDTDCRSSREHDSPAHSRPRDDDRPAATRQCRANTNDRDSPRPGESNAETVSGLETSRAIADRAGDSGAAVPRQTAEDSSDSDGFLSGLRDSL